MSNEAAIPTINWINFYNIFVKLKMRIREQQAEREKEQNDHALMLRELQKLLAQERASKDQLENQVSVLYDFVVVKLWVKSTDLYVIAVNHFSTSRYLSSLSIHKPNFYIDFFNFLVIKRLNSNTILVI